MVWEVKGFVFLKIEKCTMSMLLQFCVKVLKKHWLPVMIFMFHSEVADIGITPDVVGSKNER